MQLIVLYLATAIVFLAIDAIWLKLVMRPLFERNVGSLLADDIRLAPAAGFYLLYCAGILWFATADGMSNGAWGKAVLNAALFGFFCYGTYEATNFATLRGWTWQMVAIDVAWGTALTAASALAGMAITKALLG